MTQAAQHAPDVSTGGAPQRAAAARGRSRPLQARVTSATPGRLRVRLQHSGRDEHSLEQVRRSVSRHRGVHAVDTNPRTGSVTLRYDAQANTPDDMIALLRDVGMIIHDVAEAGDEEAPLPEVPGAVHSSTAAGIIDVLDDLDQRISRLTGRRLDLKLVFPLALAGLGVRQILTEGLGLTQVPGYVLLWYAFDSFYKLHQQFPVTPTDQPAEPASTGTAAEEGVQLKSRG